MIKEVFLISDGILQLHYSADSEKEDIDQAILSSGLLDAIRSFTEHAREEVIDSVVMQKERFYFRKCDTTERNTTLAVVFDSEISEKYAKNVLKALNDEISQTDFINESIGNLGSENEEKTAFKERIAKLSSQFFSSQYDEEYVTELLSNRQYISLAFLLDTDTNELITSFSRPKALFQPKIVSDFNLFLSNMQTTLNRLGFPSNYHYFIISSSEYSVASIQSGSKISLASGALMVSKEHVLETALEMSHYSALEEFLDLSNLTENTLSEAILTSEGNLEQIKGKPLNPMANIVLSTLINNLNNFFKLVTRRTFSSFTVYVGDNSIHKLHIEALPQNKKKVLISEYLSE